jgi:uncharacterized protein DUF7002
MGVTPEELAILYPRLYHMAEPGSWESIRKYGLHSTSSLLSLFEITGDERRNIEVCKRKESREIAHAVYGRAVIRDQKPIIESKLETALHGCTLAEWYSLLNSRVFFWLTIERLNTLLSAKEYRNKPHTVLTLETLPLVRHYEPSITLSPMNSGNTLPIAHPRGPDTFKVMDEYPFQERMKRGPYYTVVELAVTGGVPDISDYTLLVQIMVSDGAVSTSIETVYSR